MTDKIPTKDVTPKTIDPKNIGAQNTAGGGSLYAQREHIYVRRIKGTFQKLRGLFNWLLMLLYFGTVWLQYDGRQAIFFDLPNRQFHIFGATFFPQDFVLLAWLLIICAFGLFFITNFAGRVWCGYTCPQSVWTFLFIWAEDVTEGSPNKRRKLDHQPMSRDKLTRKSAKHAIWLLIAAATAITFVGYFSPIRQLIPNIFAFDLGSWEMWWLGFFTFFTYLNAGWLREQVCIYMCPYARFQSVMFDRDTLIVSYDEARGEPRGARKKSADPKAQGLGDCIDCNLCVQVCPTGIDIRDGLQYECITCAACVDACDQVMEKMGYAPGLISYTTENEQEGRKSRILRPRLIGYFMVLVGMIAAFTFAVGTRVPAELEVLRDRNQLLRMTDSGEIENSYRVKIANMTQQPRAFELSVSGIPGIELKGTRSIQLGPNEVREFLVQLVVDPEAMQAPAQDVLMTAVSDEGSTPISISKKSRFIGQVQR